MTKYDCSKIIDYKHEIDRLCGIMCGCDDCPVNISNDGYRSYCTDLGDISDAHIKALQKWSDTHPEEEIKPTLTPQERAFIEAFACPNNAIKRDNGVARLINFVYDGDPITIPLKHSMFRFIEDGTSWWVEDLLKLEVK